MKPINIPVQANVTNMSEEIDLVSSIQAIVQNVSVENLKVLAEKSKKPGINKKIQTYKKFM
ncbi:hypothetical protein KDU71_02570 [Carboxylicivirga sediminis]|uniref:Uncharacterized protein n=1 Tax=Carboxylicivirga sediminis TaxID=2006564 RepID=A0A941F0Z3_9BACT|nr:hypothetical protein [Carboxylicivirga sediminis]MBR8534429.1 hypothetical protein [Carboxylicivirga sediminis]